MWCQFKHLKDSIFVQFFKTGPSLACALSDWINAYCCRGSNSKYQIWNVDSNSSLDIYNQAPALTAFSIIQFTTFPPFRPVLSVSTLEIFARIILVKIENKYFEGWAAEFDRDGAVKPCCCQRIFEESEGWGT